MADSPLQQQPVGLTGYFNTKVLGQNPAFFGEVVMPVADVRAFYGVNQARGAVIADAAPVLIGGTQNFAVPAGKVWRVLAIGSIISASATTAFTTDVRIAVGLQAPDNGVFTPVGSISFPMRGVTLTTVDEFAFGYWFDEPPVLPAGWACGVRTAFTVTVLGMTRNARIIYQEFDL